MKKFLCALITVVLIMTSSAIFTSCKKDADVENPTTTTTTTAPKDPDESSNGGDEEKAKLNTELNEKLTSFKTFINSEETNYSINVVNNIKESSNETSQVSTNFLVNEEKIYSKISNTSSSSNTNKTSYVSWDENESAWVDVYLTKENSTESDLQFSIDLLSTKKLTQIKNFIPQKIDSLISSSDSNISFDSIISSIEVKDGKYTTNLPNIENFKLEIGENNSTTLSFDLDTTYNSNEAVFSFSIEIKKDSTLIEIPNNFITKLNNVNHIDFLKQKFNDLFTTSSLCADIEYYKKYDQSSDFTYTYFVKIADKQVYATKAEEDTTSKDYVFSLTKDNNVATFAINENVNETTVDQIFYNQSVDINDILALITGSVISKSFSLDPANLAVSQDSENSEKLVYNFTIPDKPADDATSDYKKEYYETYCNQHIVKSLSVDFTDANFPVVNFTYTYIAANGYTNDDGNFVLTFYKPQSQSSYDVTLTLSFSNIGKVKVITYPDSIDKYSTLIADNNVTYMTFSSQSSDSKAACALINKKPDSIPTIPSTIMVGEDTYNVALVLVQEVKNDEVLEIITAESIYGCSVSTSGSQSSSGIIKIYSLSTTAFNTTTDFFNNGYSAGILYLYSETEPTTSGNYWHYDTDGKTPIVWDAISGVTFEEVNGTIYVMTVKDTTTKAVYIPLKDGNTNVGGTAGGLFAQSTQLNKIFFEGTLEQWNALDKNTPYGLRNETKVICSDGEITLDADYSSDLIDGGDIGGIGSDEGLTHA